MFGQNFEDIILSIKIERTEIKGEIKHEVLENPSAIWGITFNNWHFYYRNQFQNCGYDPPKQYGFVTKFKKFPYVEGSACTSNSKFLHISHQ